MRRRKAAALLLSAAVAMSILPGASAEESTPHPPEQAFADWPTGSWCEEAMRWGVENGVVRGRTETSIDPWATAKRSEFAALLNRVFATYHSRDLAPFQDVDVGAWYYRDLAMSYQMQTLQGTGEAALSPDLPVTREQAITAISRVLCLPLPEDPGEILSDYADAGELSPWAVAHTAATVRAGIIVGTAEDQLSPKKEITRAELVQALRRVFYRFADGTDEVTGEHPETVIIRSANVSVHDAAFAKDLIIANGVGEQTLNLSNVTIKGRLLVWGGSTVNVTGSSTVAALTLPRNDGPVKVVFDATASALSAACLVSYPDVMCPDNEAVFTYHGGGTGSGGGTGPTPPPTPPNVGPGDVPLDHVVSIMYWDWDNSLLGVQYVDHSDVRADVNRFVAENFIHPDLVGRDAASLARIDSYRGTFPAEGPRPVGTVTGTVVTDGDKYPLTNKLDYVFFKRVTEVRDGVWSQLPGASAYDSAYPYIHGWALAPTPGTNVPAQGDNTVLEPYYTVLGHSGELAAYNGHAATTGKMDSMRLTEESDYLRIADFSDIRQMEDEDHVVTVKAIYEPGRDLLGPDDGGFYTMSQPEYMKINSGSSSDNTTVFEIQFSFSRYWAAADGIHGVSRIRKPTIDVLNVSDMFYIGVHDHTNHFHSELWVEPEDTGETLSAAWQGVSEIHSMDYHLVDVYGTNFVVAPVRSLKNEEQPTPVLPNFACSGYAGYGLDSKVGPKDERLPRPDTVYGTDDFVFWGTLNRLVSDMTAYALNDTGFSFSRENLKDMNIRDSSGQFITNTFVSSERKICKKLAAEAYGAHLAGNNEWWDAAAGRLDLNYHQVQYYMTYQELLTRAEADALTFPWCRIHDECMGGSN